MLAQHAATKMTLAEAKFLNDRRVEKVADNIFRVLRWGATSLTSVRRASEGKPSFR